MRSFLLTALFMVLYLSATLSLQAQVINCGENTPKISFHGKAPHPWAINGNINDWETILGPVGNNPQLPFNPPAASAFNWTRDQDRQNFGSDSPLPDQDINLLSFIHDNYNVYFYFRRLANGSSPNSFYYFFDVNADGYMNEGEPVFHATFNNNHISSFTLSRYIPNTKVVGKSTGGYTLNVPQFDSLYVPGKGNPLGVNYGNGFGAVSIDAYPMPGTLKKVFNANDIPHQEHLRKNEVFAAAITENGYGVELAIPWRFLKFWIVDKEKVKLAHLEDQLENSLGSQWENSWLDKLEDQAEDQFDYKWKNTKPLKPGEIFFYKLEMMQGRGKYTASKVVDNVGNCCSGVGRSGNVAFTKNLSTKVLVPHQSFRYYLTYTNRTNASEFYEVTEVSLRNIQFYDQSTATNQGISIKIYADRNGNRQVDAGETGAQFSHDDESANLYDFAAGDENPAIAIAPPYGKVYFIVDITLPPGLIKTADAIIGPEIVDFVPLDLCDIGAGGRTINQAGAIGGTISKIIKQETGKEITDNKNAAEVIVYPNPSAGTVNVKLPAEKGIAAIELQDYLGRNIQKWSNVNSSLQVNNLKRGVYILKVQYLNTGKQETRKIIVQ